MAKISKELMLGEVQYLLIHPEEVETRNTKHCKKNIGEKEYNTEKAEKMCRLYLKNIFFSTAEYATLFKCGDGGYFTCYESIDLMMEVPSMKPLCDIKYAIIEPLRLADVYELIRENDVEKNIKNNTESGFLDKKSIEVIKKLLEG